MNSRNEEKSIIDWIHVLHEWVIEARNNGNIELVDAIEDHIEFLYEALIKGDGGDR
jgi:hypothetical protein